MSGSEQLLLAPTPFIIGIPTSFLVVKRNVALPEDVWLVDLDEAKIMPPETSSEGRSTERAFHMNDPFESRSPPLNHHLLSITCISLTI